MVKHNIAYSAPPLVFRWQLGLLFLSLPRAFIPPALALCLAGLL